MTTPHIVSEAWPPNNALMSLAFATCIAHFQTSRHANLHVESGSSTASSSSGAATSGHLILAEQLLESYAAYDIHDSIVTFLV